MGRIQIHGDLTEHHGVFTEFVNFKAQFVQQLLICKQFTCRFRGKPNGDGSQQRLGGDLLLVGLQLFEEDPLMGGMLVDEVGFFACSTMM